MVIGCDVMVCNVQETRVDDLRLLLALNAIKPLDAVTLYQRREAARELYDYFISVP